MSAICAVCALMLLLTASTHYETLALLNARLPRLAMPRRLKVLVVLVVVFLAHLVEMALYALAYRALDGAAHVGALSAGAGASFASCLYFSIETFTSLGFGDLTPSGPLRLLAGVETLNGLLLVGWSASYIHLAMDRFWSDERVGPRRHGQRSGVGRARPGRPRRDADRSGLGRAGGGAETGV